MSDNSLYETRLSGEEADTIQYRAVSVLAVAAVVLGFASALALINPLLWIVPVLGIAAAVMGLMHIERNPALLTGRGLAMVGLALSVLFGVGAPARHLSRAWWLEQRAHRFADEWLQLLVAGDVYRAHQLMQTGAMRLPLDADLDSLYSDDARKDLDENFLGNPLVVETTERGPDATFRFVSADALPGTDSKDYVDLRYEISGPDDASPTTAAQMIVERSPGAEGPEEWRVVRFSAPQ